MTAETKRVAWIAAVAAIHISIPLPAQAKGPGLDHVELDGTGIGEPIRLEKRYPYLLDDAIFMHVFGSSHDPDIGRDEPQRSDLGPHYQLSYHLVFGEPVVVDLYPYAEGGPVAFVRPGQVVSVPTGHSGENQDFEVNAGWYDYKPAMISLLREQGLPAEEAVRTSPWVRVIATGAMTLAAFLVFRRRSRSGSGVALRSEPPDRPRERRLPTPEWFSSS